MRGDPWLDGRLVGFDLETTGLDREVEEPVSYGFSTFNAGVLVEVEEGFIEPTRTISAGAFGVHGLTVDQLVALGAVDHAAGVSAISKRLVEESVAGVPIVGTNLSYDLTMVDRCLWRLPGASSLAAEGWQGPVLDVLVIDRAMDADFEARPVRRLSALCEHYGVTADHHSAVGDATASVQILLAQCAQFPELAMRSLADLFESQLNWHEQWCDASSAQRVALGGKELYPPERAWPVLARTTLF